MFTNWTKVTARSFINRRELLVRVMENMGPTLMNENSRLLHLIQMTKDIKEAINVLFLFVREKNNFVNGLRVCLIFSSTCKSITILQN